MYIDKPLKPAPNPAAAKLQAEIARAHKMFIAYSSHLTEYGQEGARSSAAAFAALERENYDSEALLQAERQVLSVWPDPTNLNVTDNGERNWFNWFVTNDIFGGIRGQGKADDFGLGLGCARPCGHCFEGNGSLEVKHSPLFVAVRKLQVDYNSIAWPSFDIPRRINIMDWYDPFFGFSFDALISFAFNFSPNGTKPRITLLSRGWDEKDQRAQLAVENFISLTRTLEDRRVFISFNLASSEPDLDFITALFKQKTGQDREAVAKVVARYGVNYGNVFNTFGGGFIDRIGIYDALEEPSAFGSKDYQHLPRELWLQSTRKALKQAIEKTTGIRRITLQSKIDDDQNRRIFTRGRGADFLYRLVLANQGDERCLQPNRSNITDDLIPDPGYPVVIISQDGQIKVFNQGRQVFQSSSSLLPPLEYHVS